MKIGDTHFCVPGGLFSSKKHSWLLTLITLQGRITFFSWKVNLWLLQHSAGFRVCWLDWFSRHLSCGLPAGEGEGSSQAKRYIFPHLLYTFSEAKGHSRSIHQLRSSNLMFQNIHYLTSLTVHGIDGSIPKTRVINPLPAGDGGRICHLMFFQNNSKIVADIDTKFSVPCPTSIWHRMAKFGGNWAEQKLRNWRFCGVISRQFWPKSAQCWEIHKKGFKANHTKTVYLNVK